MKPMLARTLGPKFDQYPCYVQPKLNGVRALFQSMPSGFGYHVPAFQSRDEKVWSPNVLDHLNKELYSIRELLGSLILDGELYVHGWRLQDINAAVAVNRKEPTDKTPHVCFHVFDVVDPSRDFSHRWFDLYNPLKSANLPHILPVPTALVHDRNELDLHFHMYTRLGYEGIMLRPDGPYEFGEHIGRNGTPTQFRSRYLWKHKMWEDGEFLCVGLTQGEGKADIGAGALILSTDGVRQLNQGWELNDIQQFAKRFKKDFRVGTGLTDSDRIAFMQNPPIGKLVKVRYLCLTNDGIPFNPSFLCVIQ